MKSREMEIIKELMAELESQMEYGEDDFKERLSEGKPEIEVMKIEGEMPMKMEGDMPESEMAMDMMGEDEEMEDEFDPEMGAFFSKKDPKEMLKKRLMKLGK